MSERLRRNAHVLKALHKASPTKRKQILRAHCGKDFINCVGEISKNVLKGNVRLTAAQRKGLRRRKKTLQLLARKKTSIHKKKRLIQSGGFLGVLIPAIVSLLGSVIGSFTNNRSSSSSD
jgi:hypothetical protein